MNKVNQQNQLIIKDNQRLAEIGKILANGILRLQQKETENYPENQLDCKAIRSVDGSNINASREV